MSREYLITDPITKIRKRLQNVPSPWRFRALRMPIAFSAILIACASAATVSGQDQADPGKPQAVREGETSRPGGGSIDLNHTFASPWKRLESDGIHDPSNPALPLLQQPEEALSTLPPALEGNNVDWVKALRDGYIDPRTNIYPETKVNILDTDVLMEDTANMPIVLFPHRAHTEWLDCSNCHDGIFKAKKGANNVDMFSILQGEYCGQCHGAVAFPLTQCQRCHSVPRDDEAGAQ